MNPYGDETPQPAPFRVIRPTAPVHELDKPRERGPRRVRWPEPREAAPTPPRAVGRVARPGAPVPPPDLARRAVEPQAAPTVAERTVVDHAARTLQLGGVPDALAELAVKAVHAAEVCCAAARAALEDSDPDAARGYLDKAATMLETARAALR